MSQAKRTFTSALWNHAGKILEYLLMYVTSIVIARGLGVAENGRFVGLFSLSQLLLVLCSFGLETSLNKFIPQLTRERNNEKVTYVLRKALMIRGGAFFGVAILICSLVMFVSVPFFAENEQFLLWILLFTGVRSIFPLFAMVLTAQLRTALTARINLVIRVMELAAILVLTHLHFTVQNIFILFLCTSALHVVSYAVFSRTNFVGEAERIDMKPIITFGGIYWMNTIVDFILGRQGDVLFLTNLLPDSSQAGLYDVAYSVAQLASMAMTVGLSGVTFATFARLAVSDTEIMDRFYGFSIRIISLLTIPLYAFLIFNAASVLPILYSTKYAGAVSLVQGILFFRTASRLFGGPENGEYLLSHGRVGTLVSVGIISALENFILNVLLIPKLGAMGSVIASGCGNLTVNLLGALAVYKISESGLQLFFWGKLTAACFFASFFCFYFFPTAGVSSLIFSGLLYVFSLGSLLLIIKPLTPKDFQWLSQIDERLGDVLQPFTRVPRA